MKEKELDKTTLEAEHGGDVWTWGVRGAPPAQQRQGGRCQMTIKLLDATVTP